ncbi:MAG: hypothetical protein L3J74_08595, partial [Bacteroidales bacterium]|nr:hypothetical protein [Bacteroidales bacterium]
MNKFIIILTLLLIQFSCKNEKKSFATFSGTIKNTKETFVKIVDYNHSYEKKILLDKSGKFSDTIHV